MKAHLSVLLALIALDKAAGYVLQRWSLVNAQDGYVNGAGYTDVHARLPAETLLIYVSIFAAAILLFNIRRQGWTLPVLAVGHLGLRRAGGRHHLPRAAPGAQGDAGTELARGALHPAEHHGHPGRLRHQRRAGAPVPGRRPISPPARPCWRAPTIANIRQWDPDPTISLQTFQRRRASSPTTCSRRSESTATRVDGQLTPVLIGVRNISAANLPSPSWVNTHLQYTHGNGAAVALANQTNSNNPVTPSRGCRPRPRTGMPAITQPDVYFGLQESGYVVANTKQPEVDYQRRTVTASRATTRAPAASSCRRSSSGPPSRCAWATSTC